MNWFVSHCHVDLETRHAIIVVPLWERSPPEIVVEIRVHPTIQRIDLVCTGVCDTTWREGASAEAQEVIDVTRRDDRRVQHAHFHRCTSRSIVERGAAADGVLEPGATMGNI